MIRTPAQLKAEREHLAALATAMTVHLAHDECGDPLITGERGNIHADGTGYSVSVMLQTNTQWTWAKKRLAFCRLTQDGDSEGFLHLPVLPSADQAAALRDILGIRKITEHSPEMLERLRGRMSSLNATDLDVQKNRGVWAEKTVFSAQPAL